MSGIKPTGEIDSGTTYAKIVNNNTASETGNVNKSSPSYATTVNSNSVKISNKLNFVQIEINIERKEVVIFYEELVANGKNGPWLVNNKPLLIQKWDVDVCMEKKEPNKLPLWVKQLNVPLEVWSSEGISALASRLGTGRLSNARVLVEVYASKDIVNQIEIQYKSAQKEKACNKFVQVQYLWKHDRRNVFGHDCEMKKIENVNADVGEKQVGEGKKSDEDGFVKVSHKKQNSPQPKKDPLPFKPNTRPIKPIGVTNKFKQGNKFVVKPKVSNEAEKGTLKSNGKKEGEHEEVNKKVETSPKKKWTVHNDILAAIKRDANKEIVDGFNEAEKGTLKSNGKKEDEHEEVNKKVETSPKKKWTVHNDILAAIKRDSNKFVELEGYDMN
nr:hypothetical protein [Tanacetum cinerariifolium]